MAGEDSLFEQVLAPPYTDLRVIDLDGGDEVLQISLPEGHRPSGEVFLHHTTETLDQRWVDLDLGRQMLLGPFEGSLRPITVRLEDVQAVLKNFIKVRDPVLNKPIKAIILPITGSPAASRWPATSLLAGEVAQIAERVQVLAPAQ